MGSLVIAFVFCLAGSLCTGSHQKTVYSAPEDGIDLRLPMMCAKRGQELAIQWIDQHPKWELRSWRCAPMPNDDEL